MVGLELFETVAEDFRATLEHGKASLNGADKRGIAAELESAERRANLQKSKPQDHYATLGECNHFHFAARVYLKRRATIHPGLEKFIQIARAYEVLSDSNQTKACV